MTDPHPPTDDVSEEQASLYVLDLLEARERRFFERRLHRDADLRRRVHGLQAALEAEVFTDPAPSAPSRIWGKILERTRSDGFRWLAFPVTFRHPVPQLAAMAACLVLGAFLHVLWSRGVGPFVHGPGLAHDRVGQGVRLARGSGAGTSAVGGTEGSTSVGPLVQRPEVSADEAPGPGSMGAVGTEAVQRLEARNAALQGRVRGLSAQVAELGQQVQQLSLIPSGVSRIHVFPLGLPALPPTTPLPSVDGPARTNSLAESLARLAGERMAAALYPPSNGGPGQDPTTRSSSASQTGAGVPAGTEAVGKVALVPAQPVSPEPANPSTAGPSTASLPGAAMLITADSSAARQVPGGANPASAMAPIVFSAPDLGVHALAVPTAPAGGQYQLWSRAADGTVASLGVVTHSASPVSVLTFERGSVDGLFMSLEPVGGSLQPTGPVVGSGQNPVLPGLARP